MQVRVAPDWSVHLDEPADFKGFSLRVEAPPGDAARLATALTGIARLDGQDHAWVDETWLRGAAAPLAADPDWQAGFARMLDYARKSGWVDEKSGAIRAHIEGAAG